MAETPLHFPAASRAHLEPHLPPSISTSTSTSSSSSQPFITLTFATSLDSALSLGPGIRTALSGPESKAMTHYLRTRHDAICVGVGTAIADDPGLNSRLHDDSSSSTTRHQPRPVVIDPHLRWDVSTDSKVVRLAREGKGLAPFVVTAGVPSAAKRAVLEDVGGRFIVLREEGRNGRFEWRDVFAALRREGLRSVMVEGGGQIINSLLGEHADLVDSVIVTIAPTWLGRGGVEVCPPRATGKADQPVARLANPVWMPLGEDVVLCGTIAR